MQRSFWPGLALSLLITNISALDWPQWQGPDRDNVSKEVGLLKEWPAEGPKRVWLFEKTGLGYGGPSILKGVLYINGTRDDSEMLLALNAADGKEVWSAKIGSILDNNWGDGPRGTPTADGERIYTLGGQGTLICVEAKDGKILWKKTMQELGGQTPKWGFTESVLVDDKNVYCTPGGSKGAIAALNKTTGALVWQSKQFTEGAQYASIVPAQIGGSKQLIQLTMNDLVGVSAADGKLIWQSDFPYGQTAVIPTPIYHNSHVYITAGYGAGCKLVKITGNKAQEVYANKVIKNHHGGVVLINGKIYGNSDPVWVCQDFMTGKEVWSSRRLGKGAVTAADGMLYCLEESSGTVVLVEANPEQWREHGRFKLQPQSEQRSRSGAIWTHPVIANGRLFLRDQELLYCFDISGKTS